AFSGRKARPAEIELCRHGPVFLRQPGRRPGTRSEALPARRAGDHRPEPPVSGTGQAERRDHGSRLRLARYRHARITVAGQSVHCHAGAPPGPEGGLSGRDRLPPGLDRCGAGRDPGPAIAEEWLWPIPDAHSEGTYRMNATPLAIPEVILFEPKVFGDDRGFFFESFNQTQFDAAVGRPVTFVQDNHS